jgi:hypothetical protein
MALDTGIARSNIVHLCWIENIVPRWMGNVLAAGAMAPVAADVPFRDLLGVEVVVNGVAAIASWPCRPLHVVRKIKGCPPVGACIGDVIFEPLLIADVPLRGERVVVIVFPYQSD